MQITLSRHGILQFVFVLGSLWLLGHVLVYARDVLIPVITAGFVAVLLTPIVSWLEQWMSRTAASIVCVGIGVATVTMLLLWFVVFQIAAFYQDIPTIKSSLAVYGSSVREVLERYVAVPDYMPAWSQWLSQSMETITRLLLGISTSILYTSALCIFFIFYVLFMLIYRHRLLYALLALVSQNHHATVKDIVFRIRDTVSQYLAGVVTVIIMLAIYNMLVLHALDIPYATLWAMISSILYIIPYIGITIGAAFPAAAALLLQQSVTTALLVILVYVINQVIENNILTPYVVGGRVSINPLFVLIAFFAGGQMWGVSGMILFLPLLSVVKVICDHIPALQPYGYLLGTEQRTHNAKESV